MVLTKQEMKITRMALDVYMQKQHDFYYDGKILLHEMDRRVEKARELYLKIAKQNILYESMKNIEE